MESHKRKNTLLMLLTALFTALTTVATVLIQIPGVQGYINFGDAVIFISAYILGGASGFIVGGVGSLLADLFTGYFVYAPFTFVIKGLEGLMCGLIYRRTMKSSRPLLKRLISALAGGVICWLGYFLTDLALFGIEIALLTLALTPVQVGVSIVIALFASPKLLDIVAINKNDETTVKDVEPDESDDERNKE
ncbi:MAG: ECF transporter S component [Clostridia bacterium]|nr:ECF transporter S component [Clostridia bacterium]